MSENFWFPINIQSPELVIFSITSTVHHQLLSPLFSQKRTAKTIIFIINYKVKTRNQRTKFCSTRNERYRGPRSSPDRLLDNTDKLPFKWTELAEDRHVRRSLAGVMTSRVTQVKVLNYT